MKEIISTFRLSVKYIILQVTGRTTRMCNVRFARCEHYYTESGEESSCVPRRQKQQKRAELDQF